MIELGGGALCEGLIDFVMPLKLVTLIKMCLNETCCTVRPGKHLSDELHSAIANIRLDCDVRKGRGNQDGLKLNGKQQFLVCEAILVEWANT